MNTHFQELMNRATSLTRSGDLQAATAALQAALAGGSLGKVNTGSRAPMSAWDVIDVDAREVRNPFGAANPLHAEANPLHAAANPPHAAANPPRAAAKDSFVAGFHACAAGRREYKLYVPPQAGQRPLALVVMLHGCTQSPDDFAAGTLMNEAAREQGFYVLYPAQTQQANSQRCWNWFKHTHQQRGRGEPAVLASMVREVMAQHRIDPQRVYAAGLSAGGAMAAILGQTHPELFAAVGVHSGLAAGAAKDLPSALAAMKTGPVPGRAAPVGVPTIVFHGDADAIVHPSNAEAVAAASAGAAEAVKQLHATSGKRAASRRIYRNACGEVRVEHWLVHGAGHAWSGGSARGSYTDPQGPDASAEMLRFFFEHPQAQSQTDPSLRQKEPFAEAVKSPRA